MWMGNSVRFRQAYDGFVDVSRSLLVVLHTKTGSSWGAKPSHSFRTSMGWIHQASSLSILPGCYLKHKALLDAANRCYIRNCTDLERIHTFCWDSDEQQTSSEDTVFARSRLDVEYLNADHLANRLMEQECKNNNVIKVSFPRGLSYLVPSMLRAFWDFCKCRFLWRIAHSTYKIDAWLTKS